MAPRKTTKARACPAAAAKPKAQVPKASQGPAIPAGAVAKPRRSLRLVKDAPLPVPDKVSEDEEIERGANDRPLRKNKSQVRPGIIHGGGKTNADRIQAAVDREVKRQVQDAKREWASEREARLKASPTLLASVQDTRAILDNKERHTMFNPGEMVDRDLPAPFRAPSPSVTIEMQHRPLSLEPAVELSSSSKELEEFELEEFDEISIEEPNGLEENEMDEAEAEGPTQKLRLSATERKRQHRIKTLATTSDARSVARSVPDAYERSSEVNGKTTLKSKSNSTKKYPTDEGFVAGFIPSRTPLRQAPPVPVLAMDTTDVAEHDISGFDDDDVILLDGQYGRSLVKPNFIAVDRCESSDGGHVGKTQSPSRSITISSLESSAVSTGGGSHRFSLTSKRRTYSSSPEAPSQKHARYTSPSPTQSTFSTGSGYIPSYTRACTTTARTQALPQLFVSINDGIKKEPASATSVDETISPAKGARKMGRLSKANAIPAWLLPAYNDVLSTVAAAFSCHDDMFAFGGEGGEKTLLDVIVAVMQDRYPERSVVMTKSNILYMKFREGIVNFRNTFRSHAQQVVKEAIKEVVAGVSLQDSTKLERQTVRSIKEFVHDALVESQCAFFKMSEVLVKKGKKKGFVEQKKDGALQSPFITSTMARALHSSAQQRFPCPSVTFGTPWGALTLAGYTVWQEFEAWTTGVYRETVALTKEIAGPASYAFYAEWVDPLKTKHVRSQEIRDAHAAAIQLLSSPFGARKAQSGRNATVSSMPICPASDDVDIDDCTTAEEEE